MLRKRRRALPCDLVPAREAFDDAHISHAKKRHVRKIFGYFAVALQSLRTFDRLYVTKAVGT
jgi:hypothetical protein